MKSNVFTDERSFADERNSTNEASHKSSHSKSEGEKLFERETKFRKFEVFFDGRPSAMVYRQKIVKK
jgi:hypothetical protein